MQEDEFEFEDSAINAIEETAALISSLSKNKVEIPLFFNEIFFISIYADKDSPVYKYIVGHGVTEEEFAKRREKYFADTLIGKHLECNVAYMTIEGQSYRMDIEIIKIFVRAREIAKTEYGKNQIGISDIVVAYADLYPDMFMGMMNAFVPEHMQEIRTAGGKHMKEVLEIPSNMSGILTILNDQYDPDSTECRILGREEETKALIKVLMKNTKRNAVLIGEPGVGKTALVEKLTWMIVTGNCPDKLKDSVIVSLDVNSIVAGTEYRGTAEQRFKNLISFLEEHPECILFIDEVHLLLGAGACREGDLDLANAMKPILARGKTRVIGATTIGEYTNYFSNDAALKRRFEKIEVSEPKNSEVYEMIKNQITILEKAHHVLITREQVESVIYYASCFNFETKNPDRTLDLLDKVMVCAELDERNEVEDKDIFENFAVNRKRFESMTEMRKRALAYHEAGHYIVHAFSPSLIDINMLAVSIMPAEDYEGVNVFEYDRDVSPMNDLEYYIETIGTKLAGRVAEKLFVETYSAGASSDLKHATEIAKLVVTKYGLDEEFSNLRAFSFNESDIGYSDDMLDEIHKRVNAILTKAWKYDENLLRDKKTYLEALVEALMEKGMLSKNEIDALFDGVKKKIEKEAEKPKGRTHKSLK